MKEIRIRLQNALSDKTVEKLFHTDLMNIFKELGVDYPKECESLTKHILLDLKNTINLENFEERTHLMFQNYKVLGKDLLKVISKKNDLYYEAIFFEIKESFEKTLKLKDKKVLDFGCGDGKITNMIASNLEEMIVYGYDIINSLSEEPDSKALFNINTHGFLGKGIYYGKFDYVFVINVLSHCSDLNGTLERITKLTKKRVIVVETVPFYTKIRESETNKERTFLNDYFYQRIFCGKTSVPFVGNYKTPHNWDVLIAQKGFEIKSSLSKSFDFNHSLLAEEKRPIVKTKHYIGVYDKASDAITVGCK